MIESFQISCRYTFCKLFKLLFTYACCNRDSPIILVFWNFSIVGQANLCPKRYHLDLVLIEQERSVHIPTLACAYMYR